MKVAVLIPSRNRPEQLLSIIADADAKATQDDTAIVIGLDEDDPTVPEKPKTKHELIWSVEKREDSLGEKCNRCAALAPDAVGLLTCDDNVFSKLGYDWIASADADRFPDGYGMMGYGTAPWGNSPCLYAVTPKMREFLGYFAPPFFPTWYHETWMDELGYFTGRYIRSEAFTINEVGGRGKTMGLRNVVMWANFFQMTRGYRERQGEVFLRQFEPPHRQAQVLSQYPDLRDILGRRAAPNADPTYGAQLEQQFSVDPMEEARHQRLLERANQFLQHAAQIQRKRDDEVMGSVLFNKESSDAGRNQGSDHQRSGDDRKRVLRSLS